MVKSSGNEGYSFPFTISKGPPKEHPPYSSPPQSLVSREPSLQGEEVGKPHWSRTFKSHCGMSLPVILFFPLCLEASMSQLGASPLIKVLEWRKVGQSYSQSVASTEDGSNSNCCSSRWDRSSLYGSTAWRKRTNKVTERQFPGSTRPQRPEKVYEAKHTIN